jgi:hypothetical protein
VGDDKKARKYYAKLVELCKQADGERQELVEAKGFLAVK